MPCKQILTLFLIDDLRCGAPMPTLRRRPCFDFYEELCPVGLQQIFWKATDEVTVLPPEQIFWASQIVNRMFVVRAEPVSYTGESTFIPTLEVKSGLARKHCDPRCLC